MPANEKAEDVTTQPRASVRERDRAKMSILLAALDRIPDRADAQNPMEWDDLGLPK